MSESSPTPDLPPQPHDMSSTSMPGAVPPGQPKRRAWLFWLLGGIGALALLCVMIVVFVGGFLLVRRAPTAANPAIQPAPIVRSAPAEASQADESRPIYDVHADAQKDIARAVAQAKKEHKRVLIDFGADWCPDCVVLAHLFDDAKVKPFLDTHFVVVRVNVGQWDANLDVSEKYGDPIAKGIPAVVVLSPDQQIVASTGGGELANARTATKQDILTFLQQWADHS
jgi:thiol:disulfide interchange protein